MGRLGVRRVRVLLTVAACLLTGVTVAAGPAAAHGAGGAEATNFATTLDGVAPALGGARLGLLADGDRLELRNDGPEIVVLGYGGEPYLRVGPDGAFENRRSPTTEANRRTEHGPATGGSSPASPSPDAGTPPDWRKLSADPVARWHDHRIHWMGPRNPPQVAERPGERHVVLPRWEVTLQRGGERAVAYGTLTWVPAPSPAPWYALMAAAFVGIGALGLLRRWGRPLAAAVTVVLAADLVHSVSVAFAAPGGLASHLVNLVTGSFYGIIGWVLAVAAFRLLRRERVDGLYAGVFAGLSIAVFGGLLDLATLSRSVTPTTLPIGVARLCVAVAAGAGLGLAAACILVIRRTPEARKVVGGPGTEVAVPHGGRPD